MEKQYPKGIYFNAPRAQAPSFVKGSVSIKIAEAIAYLQGVTPNNAGYIYLDVLEGREDGKMYMQVNDYQPPKKDIAPVLPEYPTEEAIGPDSIPF